MGKGTKIWLGIASGLILLGCIIGVGAMSMLNWDFRQLSTVKYETNRHEIQEVYQNITIITDTADITFAVSEDGKHYVICHEQEKAAHSVGVTDGELVIQLVDNRKWYEHIGIPFQAPKITVYLPRGEYGKLSIRASTGDIRLPEDFSFESADIAVSTGDIALFSSVAETLKLKTTTGKITVSNVHCTGDLSVQVSTGKAKISARPEQLNFSEAGMPGKVRFSTFLGDFIEYEVELDDGQNLIVNEYTKDTACVHADGERVFLSFDPERISLYTADSEEVLSR